MSCCVAVPVYLYSAAHPEGRALEAIRRELGFYRPNSMWAESQILAEKPDEGPHRVSGARGVVMVGARPWVSTYNVPILSTDVAAARRIAVMVSGRGGGLPTVQTLGLVHGEESTEIACMLLEPNQIGADRVQKQVELLAEKEGLDVEEGYLTDVTPQIIVQRYINFISNHSS